MLLGTCNRHIKQAALLFQFLIRIEWQSTGKQVLFQPNYKNVFKLQAFSRVNGHQGYLLSILLFLVILVCQQRNLRQEIRQQDVLIPFFFTDCTKIMHTVYQFFNILLTAQVFRIIALINLIHNAGLTNNHCPQFICILFRDLHYKTFYQFTKPL